MPPVMRLVPSALAVPCWVWTLSASSGCQTSSLHPLPHRWGLVMSQRPSLPKRTMQKNFMKVIIMYKNEPKRSASDVLQLSNVFKPCVGFAPDWRRSRWCWTGSEHAAAAHGSPCGSGSAGSEDPGPDGGEMLTHRPFHKHLCYRRSARCTSCCPRSPVDGTGTCTSPDHQTLKEGEMKETYRCRIRKDR